MARGGLSDAAKRFLNDVVKPWEMLNQALSQNYAIDPQVSDFVRDARHLATAIKHQAEVLGGVVRELTVESRPYSTMSDVADAAKHGVLDIAGRNNTLSLFASYEFNEQDRFRFIRNAIEIRHNTYGELDFMEVSRDAIAYCIGRFPLGIGWTGTVREGPAEFHDKVRLRFDPRLGVGMNAFSVRFCKRSQSGELVVADPPNGWPFEMLDLTPTLRR